MTDHDRRVAEIEELVSAYLGDAPDPPVVEYRPRCSWEDAARAHANAMAAQQDAYLQQLVEDAMRLAINPPVIGVDPGAPAGDRMAVHHVDGNPQNNHPDNLKIVDSWKNREPIPDSDIRPQKRRRWTNWSLI